MKVGEALGGELLSLHNLEYLLIIARECRQAILSGTFQNYKADFYKNLKQDFREFL
jgi:tRNA-guanine family transglycosylase